MGRIVIKEDVGTGPGWVLVSVANEASKAAAASLSIQRKLSDKPHLGPTGWQTQPHWLVPADIQTRGGTTAMRFGPTVTAHLVVDQDLTIAIGPAGLTERHFWPDIAAPPPETLGIFEAPRAAELALGVARQPDGGSTGPQPPREPDTDTGTAPVNVPDKADDAAAAATDDGAGKSRAGFFATRHGLYAAIIAVVAVVAAVAVYVLRPDNTPIAPVPAGPGLAARYETYRQASGQADGLFALAGEALEAGEADLGVRAMSLSATRGSAAANLALARWYDPGEPRQMFDRAQPDSAALYYKQAVDAGSTEAGALLAKLCQRAGSPPDGEIEAFANFQFDTYCR